jgi:hypothetical protein
VVDDFWENDPDPADAWKDADWKAREAIELVYESFEFIMERMNYAMLQNLRQQFRRDPRILAIIDRNFALRFGETGPDTAAGSQGQDDG